jgi:flagellar basal-body rod protein FlgC
MNEGPNAAAGGRVQVLDVVESAEPLRKVYEPDNPMANADGMVFYPNVNQVAEMTDMMSASRAFETNVEVMGRIRGMQQAVLKLGEG